MNNSERVTPVYLISGFLGSGKTTLLQRLIDYCEAAGKQPAVIMNELGDINLDGQLLGGEVPMAEMLSGCICCTMRGDLGLEISQLIDGHGPDVLFIESTGAANPMETLDGVTEAALYKEIELRGIITVVDGPELLERGKSGKGRTFKLMQEQIRCATLLLLNKADKLDPEQMVEAQQRLRELNAHAPIVASVRCAIDDWSWLDLEAQPQPVSFVQGADRERHDSLETHDSHDAHDSHDSHGRHHHSHSHVMAVTHYWRAPVDSHAFESLLSRLPDDIYRAKGIVTFTDTPSRFLFQYAYKESDFIRIEPQGQVNDVAVFIGEHFAKDWLLRELEQLEQAALDKDEA